MITLQETLDDQEDLHKLCAKRGNPTVDAVGSNGFYGHGDIYKRYAELPYTHPLNGFVPHGIATSDWYWENLNSFPVPYIYCFPAYRQEGYRKRTSKEVILSASPFSYVVKMLEDQPKPERSGTLFIPAHSTKFVAVKHNYDKLAEKLLSFDDKYQPIDVCLYWKDVLLGAGEPFLAKGMKVVSAGHMYDRLFLYRFYHLLSMYKYTSGNVIGSHIFYAIKMGCAYFNTGFEYHHTASPKVLKRDVWLQGRRNVKIAQMFKVPIDTPTQKQINLAKYYLGEDYLKSSKELRRELLRK